MRILYYSLHFDRHRRLKKYSRHPLRTEFSFIQERYVQYNALRYIQSVSYLDQYHFTIFPNRIVFFRRFWNTDGLIVCSANMVSTKFTELLTNSCFAWRTSPSSSNRNATTFSANNKINKCQIRMRQFRLCRHSWFHLNLKSN